MGKLAYKGWAVILQLITFGLGWRWHVLAKTKSSGEPVDPDFRTVRVSDLNLFKRAYWRVFTAAAHGWRTKFAPFDWYVFAEKDGKVIGMEGAVMREGTVAGEPAVFGLPGALVVSPDYRRRGLAALLAIQTRDLLIAEGAEFTLGFCEDRLVDYYVRLGWSRVPNDMVYQRFGEEAVVEINVLAREHTDRKLPPGRIDIKGLPV